MKTGPLFQKLNDCDKRVIVCQGGGDSAKTTTILQVLATKAIRETSSIITVEGEDMPNLKAGALRTFQRYVITDPEIAAYIDDFNKTSSIYTFRGSSIIEFKSFEDEEDARGSERDYLYCNEINTRPYSLFWQLLRKTRKQAYMDYNPTMRFWAHEKLLDKKTADSQFAGKVQLFITDHRHNPFLSQEEHDRYESISDPDMFRVYARGQTGKVEGTIYRFTKVDKIPPGIPFGFGIDFGYNNDKCAVVKIYFDKKDRYWEELLYKSENAILDEIIEKKLDLTPASYMAKILKDNGCTTSTLVWGDHDKNWAAQLRRAPNRIPFRMARKGPNSLTAGISKVKSFNNFYFNSPNLERELETYVWDKAVDQLTGKEIITSEPIDGMPDDCLAAGRYFIHTHSLRYSSSGKEKEDVPDDSDAEQEQD